MTIENRPRNISESIEQTRMRLGVRFVKLTDLEIDLIKISRGIKPEYHHIPVSYPGPITEAISLVGTELFNTWNQIQGVGDDILKEVVEKERGRLREFFNTPLDDR